LVVALISGQRVRNETERKETWKFVRRHQDCTWDANWCCQYYQLNYFVQLLIIASDNIFLLHHKW